MCLCLCLCANAYAYALMLMLMHKWEKHKTNKCVLSSYVSSYAYAYVTGVFTCYAYVMLMP